MTYGLLRWDLNVIAPLLLTYKCWRDSRS